MLLLVLVLCVVGAGDGDGVALPIVGIVRLFGTPFLRPRLAGWYSLVNRLPTSAMFALPT